jgi:hypothetical protein
MHTAAILLHLNFKSPALSNPRRAGGPLPWGNRAEAQSRKGLRALIKDILDMISSGAIEGVAS